MADNDKKVEPSLTAFADASAGGDDMVLADDLVIWTKDLGKPRRLSQQELSRLPEVPIEQMPTINGLIKQGVALAAIPTNSGIGAACYLVNLDALKKLD